ncbi:PIR Superfamily Protein [Plasmodium ovale curtisi]|uniref:PIR Superfamily Protein n=1 Tax=Plasmodium ovale curtisi TaxID=864141 RepID=A0A1A8XBG1_PLAOA|nr:PIR Superfamily Protein [Plasmodium ovale curtisi]
MMSTKGTGKEAYSFCRNSPYYEMMVENINRVEDVQEEDVQKKKDVQNVKDACNSFSYEVCLFDKLSDEENCKKFLHMFKFLNEAYRSLDPKSTITNEDLDFLNYWLNVKLKDKSSNASMCIDKFIETIKSQGENFISKEINLEEHLNVIDRDNLENMELLYDLYHTKQKIFDIMLKIDYSNNGKTLCPEYTEKCHKRYREGIDKCLNDYDDFYKALKKFKYYYKYGIEEETDKSGYCKSSEFFLLPEYDPVLERKQKKIMLIQNITAPLIYTPLGPFLRTKINTVKNKWMNSDDYGSELSSLPTDIEDNNSVNGEYNISYYSGTN